MVGNCVLILYGLLPAPDFHLQCYRLRCFTFVRYWGFLCHLNGMGSRAVRGNLASEVVWSDLCSQGAFAQIPIMECSPVKLQHFGKITQLTFIVAEDLCGSKGKTHTHTGVL